MGSNAPDRSEAHSLESKNQRMSNSKIDKYIIILIVVILK